MYLLENRTFMCTILTRKLPSVPKTPAGPSIPNYPDPKTVVATKEKQRRDINTPRQRSIILNKCDFGFYACDAVGFVISKYIWYIYIGCYGNDLGNSIMSTNTSVAVEDGKWEILPLVMSITHS